jgi:hypothetical protein
MKTLLFVLLIAVVMAACSRNPQTGNEAGLINNSLISDTTGLAAFNAWKLERLYEKADRSNNHADSAAAHVVKRSGAKAVNRKASPSDYGSGTLSTVSENAAKAPVKKGWSKAAKGAAIGGASGAVVGAVVNKRNRIAGGVIGGIVGAGVGFGVGRTMDKKDGRY